jgi:hypothetical protein
MKKLASVSVVVFALIALAAPVGAQDDTTTIAFDGVSFAFAPDLGRSANATVVPAVAGSRRSPIPPDGEHMTFTLYGESPSGGKTPRVGWSDATVYAYRIADLENVESSTQQVESLRALLADRTLLARNVEATLSASGGVALPHLPVDTGAGQALKARATYIETPALSGIAYLIGYRQDVYPFAADEFFYTFQAISTDGTWYVSGDFAIEASGFPTKVTQDDARRVQRRWNSYVQQSADTLNAAPADSFAPSLTSIQALIDSIAFEPAVG